MAEGTYDAEAIVQALYQSPIIGSSVHTVSVDGSTVLLAFNKYRAFFILQNNGSTLYVKLGTGASLANYSFRLSANAKAFLDKWGGAVTAIRDSGPNDVVVTEVY